eukprot:c1019_g1_i1.p1 GENE.c1019_g1_i1~~c1019_g1_i1.p1  ORF type:complete len:280 (+),score=42.09 c1019_g1_i1:35-874(+)
MFESEDYFLANELRFAKEKAARASSPPIHFPNIVKPSQSEEIFDSLKRLPWTDVENGKCVFPHVSPRSKLSLFVYDYAAKSNAEVPELDTLADIVAKDFQVSVSLVWCYLFTGGKQFLEFHQTLMRHHLFIFSFGIPRPIEFKCLFTGIRATLYPQPGDLIHYSKDFDAHNVVAVQPSKFLIPSEQSVYVVIATTPPRSEPIRKGNKPFAPMSNVFLGRCTCGCALSEPNLVLLSSSSCFSGTHTSKFTQRRCRSCGKLFKVKHPIPCKMPNTPEIFRR